MKFDLDFDISGLEKTLLKKSESIENNLDIALMKSAILLHSQATLEAPVDTGNLRSSLNFRKGKEPHTYEVYTNVDYAFDVEYGTKTRKPNDFMRRSFRMKKNDMMKIINESISESLKE